MFRVAVVSIVTAVSAMVAQSAFAACPGSTPRAAVSTKTMHRDVNYGSDVRQKLDVYLPATSSGPRPAVLMFHGGSFTGGDKSAYRPLAEQFAASGVVAVSANYRFATGKSVGANVEASTDKGVLASLVDGARALQFIRCHAHELKIDPKRIVLVGNSAGASIALWVGLQQDLADPKATDAVARHSTRVLGIAGTYPQSSLDAAFWESHTFAQYAWVKLERYAAQLEMLYDLKKFDRTRFFSDHRIVDYRRRVDFVNFITHDDPELWLESVDKSGGVHSPLHVVQLRNFAESVGVKGVFSAPNAPELNMPAGEDMFSFVMRKLAGH